MNAFWPHPYRRAALWLAWCTAGIAVIFFWAQTSLPPWTTGELPTGIFLGRLAGLLATFCALMQFVLMSRGAWLEPIFGLDRLARAHHLNGYVAIILMLIHPVLLIWGYANLEGRDFFSQYSQLLSLPYVALAAVALLLFCLTVALSIYFASKHLKFETWYYVHLLNYGAIALVPWHQLTNGGTLISNPIFQWFWIGLYSFVILNLLIWRFGLPVLHFSRHQFTVAKTVSEGPRATSVYITGKDMKSFQARGGQFVLVRYFQKGFWWQEHPFSLSRLPSEQGIRTTVRHVGDFTNQISALKPGTKVLVSGPYGAFTLNRARHEKLLFIAGGIGITPIRSMLEELDTTSPRDSILLYANRDMTDIPLRPELETLEKNLPLTIHYILSDDKNAKEPGFIDQEKLRRLVPNLTERSIFLCGPPPMMNAVKQALLELGVSKDDIHYERFSLHLR